MANKEGFVVGFFFFLVVQCNPQSTLYYVMCHIALPFQFFLFFLCIFSPLLLTFLPFLLFYPISVPILFPLLLIFSPSPFYSLLCSSPLSLFSTDVFSPFPSSSLSYFLLILYFLAPFISLKGVRTLHFHKRL